MKKGGLLFLFCLASVFSIGQKKVLFEKFTNAFCGVCPDATIDIYNIVENNPDVIWISHHKPIGFMDHPLNNDSSDALWNELGVSGVPTGMIDRRLYNGNITMSRNTWESRILNHLQDPHTFNIDVSEIAYDADERELNFQVNVEALMSNLSGPFRITAYIIEDSIIRAQSSYWNDVAGHPLEGRGDLINDYEHRNVVRTILEDHWGTSNVIPDNPILGEWYTHDYNYTVADEINAENIHLVVMVSLFDEVNHYPGEVQNVVRVKLKDLGIKLTDTRDISTLQFAMGPNPTRDFIELNFNAIPDQIIISDVNGSMRQVLTPTDNLIRIDISELGNGLYFMSANQNSKRGFRKFLVVK